MPLIDEQGRAVTAVSYHPNQNLAKAIVRAWKEPGYRERLLTFHGTYKITSRPSETDYARTKKALGDEGFDVVDKPVVLTFHQYNALGYQKVVGEVVFVLPDTLVATGFTLPGAEIAMIVTPLGM